MVERAKLDSSPQEEVSFFLKPSEEVEFFPTGSTLLNCILGGGYAMRRIVNIVGDKSSGKSLLCIEAAANFMNRYPDGKVIYNEIEQAFDKQYARALGLPEEGVEFPEECYTVEDWHDDIIGRLSENDKDQPTLYILDSLDALSDADEIDRDINKGSFGTGKARKMSELFRRLNKKLSQSNYCTMIVSQVRENIGITFGRKYTQSGGKALDFYTSQRIYLSQKAVLNKVYKGVTRPYGIEIRAKCDKNKVGLPLRTCDFPILFGFGIDDATSMLDWFKAIKRLGEIDVHSDKEHKEWKKIISQANSKQYAEICKEWSPIAFRVWYDIEKGFLPRKRKYV